MRHAFIAVALILFASSSHAQGLGWLTMIGDPTTFGWEVDTWGAATAELADGQLTISTGLGSALSYRWPDIYSEGLTADDVFTLRADLQLIQGAGTLDTGAVQIVAVSRTNRYYLYVHADHIAIGPHSYTGTSNYTMNTTDSIHTYELIALGQGSVVVRVDGVIRIEATATDPDGDWPRVLFGDISIDTPSISVWDNVRVDPSVPVSQDHHTFGRTKKRYLGN